MRPVILTTVVIAGLVSFILGILSIFIANSYGFFYILVFAFFNFIIPTLIAVLLYKYILLKTKLNSRSILTKSLLFFGIQSIGLLIWIILDVMFYYSFSLEAFSSIENFKEHFDHEFIIGFVLAPLYSIVIPHLMVYFSNVDSGNKDGSE